MIKIQSLTNDKVKGWCKLSKKKFRDESGLFIVESEHLVKEALSLGLVKEIITSRDYDRKDVTVYQVNKDILKKISNLDNAPDMMAVVNMPKKNKVTGNILILDRIQDPGNLGTMIRSSVALGFETIILSDDSVDIYNDKVIRASEGMFFKINILRGDLLEIIPKLQIDGYLIYGTNVVNGRVLKDIKKDNKLAIVIGNEGSGVSSKVANLCDDNIYIPINKNCESLNAAVAASIIMYEVSR